MTLTNELLRICSTTTPRPSPTSCYVSPHPLHQDPHQRVVTHLLNHYTRTLTNELLRISSTTTPEPSPTSRYVSLNHCTMTLTNELLRICSTTTPRPSPTSCYVSLIHYTMTLTNELLRICSSSTPRPSPTSCYVSLIHYTRTLTNELLRIPQPLHQYLRQRVVTSLLLRCWALLMRMKTLLFCLTDCQLESSRIMLVYCWPTVCDAGPPWIQH